VPEAVLNAVGPIAWNAAIDRGRGSGDGTPGWSAVRVLGPTGTESLYVFPARAFGPMLLGSWPRQEIAAHWVRVFPRYRWIVIDTPDEGTSALAVGAFGGGHEPRHSRFYDAKGTLIWETRTGSVPAALGRDLVLISRPSTIDSIPPRLNVVRLPDGDARASWPGVAGWGTSSQLENFLAVNSIGIFDPVADARRDELRLLDLEGTILWARTITADPHEFAVSNFGDVAIARDRQLIVLDRSGSEKLRVPLPVNSVGRTAITPDGKFVLVAASSPVPKHPGGRLWVALYETTKKAPVWTRKNLAAESAKLADALELSVSDDGSRALLRLSTGAILLLGTDGRLMASWDLGRVSRGEYDPGFVPRRTWLSGNGEMVAITTPVAKSLPEARGWLYRVPR
jgi:hypothetical protein